MTAFTPEALPDRESNAIFSRLFGGSSGGTASAIRNRFPALRMPRIRIYDVLLAVQEHRYEIGAEFAPPRIQSFVFRDRSRLIIEDLGDEIILR